MESNPFESPQIHRNKKEAYSEIKKYNKYKRHKKNNCWFTCSCKEKVSPYELPIVNYPERNKNKVTRTSHSFENNRGRLHSNKETNNCDALPKNSTNTIDWAKSNLFRRVNQCLWYKEKYNENETNRTRIFAQIRYNFNNVI